MAGDIGFDNADRKQMLHSHIENILQELERDEDYARTGKKPPVKKPRLYYSENEPKLRYTYHTNCKPKR